MKRFLSLILVFIMVLSVASLPAFAEETVPYVESEDGKTITINTQAGWDEKAASYFGKGKTIYLNCDISISSVIADLYGSLIGLDDENGNAPVITLASSLFKNIKGNAKVDNLVLMPKTEDGLKLTSNYQGVLSNTIQGVLVSDDQQVKISNVVSYVPASTTKIGLGLVGCISSNVVGTLDNPAVIFENCINRGNMSSTSTSSGAQIGGILGMASKGYKADQLANEGIHFINCKNYGAISGKYAAGIFGGAYGDQIQNIKFSGCSNFGNITGTDFAGGIISGEYKNIANIVIENCINAGSVSATDYAGGIVGKNISSWMISKCANIGSVTTLETNAGGIAGQLGNSTVSECYNSGNITAGTSYAGGIAGNNALAYSMTIENCYNSGSVKANSYASGLMYSMGLRTSDDSLNQKLDSFYNSGIITANDTKIYNVVPIVGLGVNETYDVENIYYVEEKGGSEETTNVCKKDGDSYTSLEKVNYTKLSADILPEGLDSTIWAASEDGYPILKNNLPKNADGTDKEYYVVTLTNGANGEALKSAETYVEKGKTYTLALDPEDGYEVESVTADGVACEGINNVYEIVISDDAEVSVVYALIPVEEGTTSASQLFTTVDAETFEVYAFASFGVVTGNEAVDFGMLLSFEETDDYTFNNTSLRKFKANSANDKGQYGIKLYGNLITNDKTYYCVPYVEYTDGTVCYGSVMTVNE